MSPGVFDFRLTVDGAAVVVENTLRRLDEEPAWFGCHIYADYGASAVRRIDWTERHRG